MLFKRYCFSNSSFFPCELYSCFIVLLRLSCYSKSILLYNWQKKWAWPQSSQPYLHFDLGSIQMISRIGWTGQAYSSGKLECYVKSLMLLFSPDAKTWGMVRHVDAGIFNEFLAKVLLKQFFSCSY